MAGSTPHVIKLAAVLQDGSYELLLALADECPQDTSIRDVASQLLNLMPTFPDVSQKLTEALLRLQTPEEVSTLWMGPAQAGQTPVVLAARLQYTIQVSPDPMQHERCSH